MSIALERIKDSGFGGMMACLRDASAFQPSRVAEDDDLKNWRTSSSDTTSSSSSIGQNSDDDGDVSRRSSDDGDYNDDEVQSSCKSSLDTMNSLEEVLPIRRGISSFYKGKSKSFTSLLEAASTTSIKDIAKDENAYSRRRRNLLAINHVWDRNRSFNARANGGGTYKRPISSSRSTLALAMAMSSSESICRTSEDSTLASSRRLPPLYPQGRASNGSISSSSSPPVRTNLHCWRSFSTADMQQYLTMMANKSSSFSVCDTTKL